MDAGTEHLTMAVSPRSFAYHLVFDADVQALRPLHERRPMLASIPDCRCIYYGKKLVEVLCKQPKEGVLVVLTQHSQGLHDIASIATAFRWVQVVEKADALACGVAPCIFLKGCHTIPTPPLLCQSPPARGHAGGALGHASAAHS